MSLELLTFELQGVALAIPLREVREICQSEPGDVDLSEALGLGSAKRDGGARTLVVTGPNTTRLCVGSRPVLLTVDSAAVVDLPALVPAHPALRSLVLEEDRVIVLLDPTRVTGSTP